MVVDSAITSTYWCNRLIRKWAAYTLLQPIVSHLPLFPPLAHRCSPWSFPRWRGFLIFQWACTVHAQREQVIIAIPRVDPDLGIAQVIHLCRRDCQPGINSKAAYLPHVADFCRLRGCLPNAPLDGAERRDDQAAHTIAASVDIDLI